MIKVLLIDDDASFAQKIQEFLERETLCEVKVAYDGQMAWKYLREESSFDIIFVDLHLREFNTEDLVDFIRNGKLGRHPNLTSQNVPIVGISGAVIYGRTAELFDSTIQKDSGSNELFMKFCNYTIDCKGKEGGWSWRNLKNT